MNRGVLVIVLHHVALQEFLEAVKDQFTYDRFVKVLNQKWGETCDVFFIYTFIYFSYICGNSDLNQYCYVTVISFVWFYPI